MIDRDALEKFIETKLEGTSYFPVDLQITPANDIRIEIDSDESVDIDFCTDLTRAIEAEFPRDDEDYSLEVGSAGLTSPFKVRRQFVKNIGNTIDVLSRDGRKYTGTLLEAGDDSFRISIRVKEKPEGAKRPVEVEKELTFGYSDINRAQWHFEF